MVYSWIKLINCGLWWKIVDIDCYATEKSTIINNPPKASKEQKKWYFRFSSLSEEVQFLVVAGYTQQIKERNTRIGENNN